MEETKIKIAALQLASEIGDVQVNHQKVETLLQKQLIDKKPDIIVLPEVWTVGWECSKFIDSAEELSNSPTIELLQKLAVKYNAYIIGGSFIEKENYNYYNTCPVISTNGTLIAIYRKKT